MLCRRGSSRGQNPPRLRTLCGTWQPAEGIPDRWRKMRPRTRGPTGVSQCGIRLLRRPRLRRAVGSCAQPELTNPALGARNRDSGPCLSDRSAIVAGCRKRQVWKRDRGCCQWPVESGGTSGSTLCVEFDHRIPRARGGPSTAENVRLLCRFHNDLAARRAFGDEWTDQFTGNDAEPLSRSGRGDGPRPGGSPGPPRRDLWGPDRGNGMRR